jgi:hypothetical protein
MPILIPEELSDVHSPSVPTSDLSLPGSSTSTIFSEDDTSDCPPEQTPEPGGIIQAYLDSTLAAIKKQIDLHRIPDCYQQGSFWIQPVDKWFALQKFKRSSDPIGPEPLYYPPIFVWLPTLLLPNDFQIKCIFCGKGTMTDSGAFDNPLITDKFDAV